MNKHELLKTIAEQTQVSQQTAESVLKTFADIVVDHLEKGEDLRITNFGCFTVRHRSARKGRNPQTGEEIMIPASTTAAFKPGQRLKDAAAGK